MLSSIGPARASMAVGAAEFSDHARAFKYRMRPAVAIAVLGVIFEAPFYMIGTFTSGVDVFGADYQARS